MGSFFDFAGYDVYTSSPSTIVRTDPDCLIRVREAARWSDRAGCRGMLIYTDNRSADPWVVAQDVITHTEHLSPLIAVQPLYMHPYAAAQKVAAIASVYGRSVDVNLVAGGFQFDLAALGDRLDHDERYDRLLEYGDIMLRLLRSEAVTIVGTHYTMRGVRLDPGAPASLMPRVTVSGSSPAGVRCAAALDSTAVMYPEPITDASASAMPPNAVNVRTGIRIGLIARDTRHAAWEEAMARFPEDEHGQAIQRAANQASESQWLRHLSDIAETHSGGPDDVYWLGPFRNYRSFCPYLVGSYDEVAAYLSRYVLAGVRVLILDRPDRDSDLHHAWEVMRRAVRATEPETPRAVRGAGSITIG